jgi:uncharacterized membrane protein
VLGRVAERLPQTGDCGVQAVVEVHEVLCNALANRLWRSTWTSRQAAHVPSVPSPCMVSG